MPKSTCPNSEPSRVPQACRDGEVEPVAAAPSVLVVEDDPFQGRLMARQLMAAGAASVTFADDGHAALAALDRRPEGFGLIICDLDMPGMDGPALIRHLGERNVDAALAVVSGSDPALLGAVEAMCRAFGLRPLGVLPKPVESGTIAELLSRVPPDGPVKTAPRRAASTVPAFGIDAILDGIRAGQFEAHFQPKVSLSTGRIEAAEALARWRHPEHGVLSPYPHFLPVLEGAGQMDELTFEMLRLAARACRAWHESGHELHVAVNLSLTSLRDGGLADRIAGSVTDAGLEPRWMTLEITETAAAADVGMALENLLRLRMRGFGLSIDDFGTGYASMEQLGRVAFTELKIDRGFVVDMHERPEASAIVGSSIEVARRLGLTSVAEGVETPGDVATLRDSNCDIAQGYFFAPPLAPESFRQQLAGFSEGTASWQQ